VRGIGPETSWIVPRHRFEVPENAQEALDVLRRSAVHHVEIPGGQGNAVEYGRRHSDYDDLHPLVSETDEDLVIPGVFGCHDEF
jgi:hypothetical protein